MDFNSALDIIVKDLGEAAKIIDDLKSYSGVPAFQVELAKAKCRSAAEIILLLKEIPAAPESGKEAEAPKRPVASNTVRETEARKTPLASETEMTHVGQPIPAGQEKNDDIGGKMEVEENGETVNISSDESDKGQPGSGQDTLDFIAEEENEPTTIEEAPVPQKKETGKPVAEKQAEAKTKGGNAQIFADRFKDVPGRVSEKVQALRPEEDLTSRMKQTPINNLADAIGVNDRFYFIREVFGGNNNNYREAIERLNSVSQVNEAVEIIHGYTGGETNHEAVSDLLALVKRKTGFDE